MEVGAYRVAKAVNEYDERLDFDRNPDTGQYCVYMKMPHGEAPLPLLGFDAIPEPEDALRRLYQADTVRHGEQIFDRMLAKNEKIREASRYAADQAEWDVAERLEHLHRKLGTHPSPRIFTGG